ncbi:MAG: CFI-box-CTERM domain-containing protein, partial [Desulfobacteria bacterium]
RVNFTADTPYAVDSGVKFKSTVDNTSNSLPVSCKSGDGGGSVSTDTWIVTSPLSTGGHGCFIATAGCGFTMEPQLKVFGEFRDRILLSNKAVRSLVELYHTCFSYCGRLYNRCVGLPEP